MCFRVHGEVRPQVPCHSQACMRSLLRHLNSSRTHEDAQMSVRAGCGQASSGCLLTRLEVISNHTRTNNSQWEATWGSATSKQPRNCYVGASGIVRIIGGTDKTKQTHKCRHTLTSLCRAVKLHSSCSLSDCCNVLEWKCSFSTALTG